MSLMQSSQPQELPEDDARLALAVLLVRVGRADDHYTDEERHRTDRILSARYGLSAEEAGRLRLEAEEHETEVADNVSFTRALKRAVPFEEREQLVEALWEVVMTDRRRDHAEDGFMRLATKLLGVSDRDSALARQRVMARMT